MGTVVAISVYEKSDISLERIRRIVDEAFVLIDKYQKEVFDVNNENSEISKINKKLLVGKVMNGQANDLKTDDQKNTYLEFKVSEDLYRVFEISLEVAKETDFAFDISFKSAELLWTNALKKSKLPTKKEIERIKAYLGPDVIKLKTGNRVLIKSNAKIALGGVAKGYIMEKAFSFLRSAGLNNFIINAGGDIKLSGSKAGRPWLTSVLKAYPEPVNGPSKPKYPSSAMGTEHSHYYAHCNIKNEDLGVATSGSYYRFTEFEGKRYSHIIDTRTAIPSESDVLSVTVLYKDMSYTDAYATSFYIQGYKKLTEQFDDLDRKGLGLIVVKQGDQKAMNKTAARYCRFAN
jgi:thiamine biosynthesis lipoprotein